jgi:ABC-type sugar transport system ATPase subunit
MTTPPLLEMRGVAKSFPGVHALSGVDLSVHAGEVVALVGENGAGKSTLIKILSGALAPNAGEVRVDGRAVEITSPVVAGALGIVTVYQEFSLFPALTVAENLFFNHFPRVGPFVRWGGMRTAARELLDELGLHFSPDRIVGTLTVAEQQMLEIAKAMHRKARVLILDEPTAVLGGSDVDALLSMVKSLRDRGLGIIFISHRLDEVFELADRYVVLKDGAQVGTGAVEETDHERLVSAMVGRDFTFDATAEAPRERGPELVRVAGLTRAGAFEDISFTVHAGEVVGLAGLRGAGRSQVARSIFGAQSFDSGEVFVEGRRTDVRDPRHAVELGLGFVPEDRKSAGLHFNMSTARNITLVDVALNRQKWLDPRRERRTGEQYRERLSIRVPGVGYPVVNLSGGNQQKVVIAKWLNAGVKMLFLNEPTRGVDVGAKSEIYELISELCREGLGVLLISSELPEVLRMSDRVLVMRSGRLVADMSRGEATEERVASHMVSGVAA